MLCSYVSAGFLLSQLLHSLVFQKSGHGKVWSFFFTVRIKTSYKLALLPFFVSFSTCAFICFTKFSLGAAAILLLCALSLSQLTGRSLIKFFFEWSFCAILVIHFLFKKYYISLDVASLSIENLTFLYNDVQKVFDHSWSAYILYISIVGVRFAVDFLTAYFPIKDEKGDKEPNIDKKVLSQYEMFRYGILFLYAAIGGLYFVLYDEFQFIAKLRDLILFNI